VARTADKDAVCSCGWSLSSGAPGESADDANTVPSGCTIGNVSASMFICSW